MSDQGLPISAKRLARLTEGLSDEARTLWERIRANGELPVEMRLDPEEIMAGFEELPAEQKQRLALVLEEIGKAHGRSIRESEAQVDLAERLLEASERARELDPSLRENAKVKDVIAVLRAHGEELPVSEDELNTQIEVPVPPEDIDWVSVPQSEIPTDENGIPTKAASRDGYGIKMPEGEIIKLYPRQLAAMRALAAQRPYRDYVDDRLDEIVEMKKEFMEALGDSMSRAGQPPERFAEMAVGKVITESYRQALALMVKGYPGNPLDIIDACRGRDTKAARRYKKWTVEQAVKEMVGKTEAEAIEAGALELVVGEDGKEHLRKGPNFDAFFRQGDSEADEE